MAAIFGVTAAVNFWEKLSLFVRLLDETITVVTFNIGDLTW
jgi:hypothetical protein